MSWPQAFLEATGIFCATVVVVIALLGLMDFEVQFYPPKDVSDAMPVAEKDAKPEA